MPLLQTSNLRGHSKPPPGPHSFGFWCRTLNHRFGRFCVHHWSCLVPLISLAHLLPLAHVPPSFPIPHVQPSPHPRSSSAPVPISRAQHSLPAPTLVRVSSSPVRLATGRRRGRPSWQRGHGRVLTPLSGNIYRGHGRVPLLSSLLGPMLYLP